MPKSLNIQDIMEQLPHRYPFLLIDRVVELSDELDRVVVIKNVTVNEPQFTGHFPGAPVMPGVLIIEAMAQAYISTSLANSIVFGVLIIVLLVKPAGLLGKYVPEKV